MLQDVPLPTTTKNFIHGIINKLHDLFTNLTMFNRNKL